MNVLKETARTIPKATIYRVAGCVALGCAIAALGTAGILRPNLGIVIEYALAPLLLAILIYIGAGVTRLRLVGFLPTQADYFIPPALAPWIRFWLLARFGLLGSMLLVFIAIIGTAVVSGPVHYAVEALVYVVTARMFMDLIFGSAFNIGIISRRHATE